MDPSFFILCFAFMALLFLSVPVAVVIGLSSALAIVAFSKEPLEIVVTAMAQGVDKFPLLAIPFFILSGMLMGHGGMAKRLIDLAAALVSRFPGGLAYVNTLACVFFGSISGSSAAAVSSIGSFLIPEMEKKGYNKDFAVALTVCSSTTGMLIPPSNTMIVYSVAVGGLSVGALFMAGVIPGLILGALLMCVSFFYVTKKKMKPEGVFDIALIWKAFKRAFLSLLLIVVILGGILSGICTPTEAAAISVVYALILECVVYRGVKIKDLPQVFEKAAVTTSVVMVIIGASTAMSWVMNISNVPQEIAATLLSISENKIVLLLMINFILLGVGTFMDMTPAILIFTPIFLPITRDLGINDIHFGIMMIANLSIGLCTPPVGTCLFLGCSVGNTNMTRLTPKILPFVAAMLVAVILITFVPWLSLALPDFLNQ